MSELPEDRDGYCYRHPDRQSYILCQRCARTICPQCATQAVVGVHCPECVKEAKASMQRTPATTRVARSLRSPDRPIVSYVIMAICVAMFIAQSIPGLAVTGWVAYWPPATFAEPWRLLTSLVAHGSIMHLAANMISLFIVGRMLEPYLGRIRYLALFVVSGIGGAAALALISPLSAAVGASGAIFGMFGALFVLLRRFGGNTSQIVTLVAINLVIGFVVPGIAWEAHIGGLLVGAAVTVVYTRTRAQSQRWLQVALVAGIAVACLAAVAIRFSI